MLTAAIRADPESPPTMEPLLPDLKSDEKGNQNREVRNKILLKQAKNEKILKKEKKNEQANKPPPRRREP